MLRDASESCRVEGEDLIVEHCYIERRLRPLNLFLREAEPAAAESAIVDYGNALRDLAASNVFPGDLLLKNFGVTSHGRVIFYDYDEIGLVSDCVFRDLPRARTEEEEASAEPWFHCGPRDVFPEQWLPFLSIPAALSEVFIREHGCLLDGIVVARASVAGARGRSRPERSIVERGVDQIAEQAFENSRAAPAPESS